MAPVADPAPVAAPVPDESDWAGGYVGASLGYAFAADDVVGFDGYDAGSLVGRSTDLGSVDVKGPNVGLHAGYRWQRNDWVFGPELWIEGGSIDATDRIAFSAPGIALDDDLESSVNYILGLQFKTGYVANPRTLVYGTAGLVHGDFDYEYGAMKEGYTASGYSLGLGVERKLRENLSVFAEWQYRNFGKTDVTYDLGGGQEAVTRATPEHHNIKLGVNFSF